MTLLKPTFVSLGEHHIYFALVLVFLAMCCQSFQAQEQSDTKKMATLDRLCGRLEHVEYLPVKNAANSFTTKTKALKHVTLRLYESKAGVECCKSFSTIEEVNTGLNGNFKFKTKNAGLYWLVAVIDGNEHKMDIRFQPQKQTDTLCINQYFQIDNSGNFGIAETVTVD
ncbi:MAG TPA: hypothetical protein VLK33_01745 [Terriglobales bacterium]|nr:hypothetical protein [Terriglobales bacterium]